MPAFRRFSRRTPLSVAIAILLLTLCGLSQQSSPSSEQSPKAAPAAPDLTIKSQVRQVIVDVVVTDKKHHPVLGLRKQDFSVFEDGAPQQIGSFVEHTADSQASGSAPQAARVLPPNTFANTPAEEERPPVVLLYDLLNTPMSDQSYAHKEMENFLRNRRPGTRIAIFVLSDRLYLLQGFTENEHDLLTAVSRKGMAEHESLADQARAGTSALDMALNNGVYADNNLRARNALANMKEMEERYDQHLLGRRADRTLIAFKEIAMFLNGLPGRKDLVWLSGSFPAELFPTQNAITAAASIAPAQMPADAQSPNSAEVMRRNAATANPTVGPMSFSQPMREAADLLAASRVAVYPVDIRGLTTDPVMAAAFPAGYRTRSDFDTAHMQSLQDLWKHQAVMESIADETGGHAFINTNGLADAIATSTDEGSNYYTLAYSPSNLKFDGQLRHIHVKLAQAGYYVAYRRSYLADDKVVLRSSPPLGTTERLQIALRRGAPQMNELVFQVYIKPDGSARAAKPAEIAQLSKFPAYSSGTDWHSVKIQRYTIEYTFTRGLGAADPAPDGTRRGKLEFFFGAYDGHDDTMFGERTPVDRAYQRKDWEGIQNGSGYRMSQVLEIPSDTAWLRLAVRDDVADHIGSVEIPLPLSSDTRQR